MLSPLPEFKLFSGEVTEKETCMELRLPTDGRWEEGY